MSDDRLIVVGKIAGAFGVKGEVRVQSFTEEPDDLFEYGPLVNADGEVVLTPVRSRPLNDGYGVIAEEKLQREDWEAMRGVLLHVYRDQLPEPDEDEIYVEDLIGMAVEHVDGRVLGVVSGANNFGAGDLIEVKPASGPSFLLPFTLAVVPEVDVEKRVVRVAADDALLPESFGVKPEGDAG